jgi:hypothetical protein
MNQGTRWALLVQKNRHRKSHAWAPLNMKVAKLVEENKLKPKKSLLLFQIGNPDVQQVSATARPYI